MAMNFGEALAQGIVKGLGTGGQQYFADMRRKRLEREQMDNAFDAFTKQKVFAQQLGMIEEQRKNQQEWERAAKLQPEQLAYEISMNMSKDLAPTDRPVFIRDSLKRMSGMKMPALLSYGGYSQADYTPWASDPAYKDAIPQANTIGSDEPDDSMERMYQYKSEAWNTIQAQQTEKVTAYTQKRDDDLLAINSVAAVNYGSKLSPDAAKTIWKMAGGADGTMQGAQLTSASTGLMQTWLQKGVLVDTGSEIVLRSELEQEPAVQPDVDQQATQQAQPQAQPLISPELYEDPAKASQIAEKKEMAAQKQIDTDAKAIGKALDKNKPLPVINAIGEAQDAIRGLDKDALSYLTGIYSLGGTTFKDMASKLGDDAATKAREAQRKLAQIKNIILKERSGAAVTDPEMKRFIEELDQPGIFKTPEAVLDGLSNLFRLNNDYIVSQMAGFSPEAKKEFARREPDYAPFMPAEEATEEDKMLDGTNQTVSGLDISMLDAEDQKAIRDALAQGIATKEDVQAYIAARQ